MKLASILPLALASAILPATAAPAFDQVLQDHMVFQRDQPVTVWGTAKNGGTVTVEWKGHSAKAEVTKGKWKAQLPASAADAEGSTITATDATGSAELKDVLVGDVWLASGQSNMERKISETAPIPGDAHVNNDQIRLLRGFGMLHGVSGAYSKELYEKAEAANGYEWEWRISSTGTIKDFSAIAIYFASYLQPDIKVPVGIISQAKGGSSMEAWIPQEIIDKKKTYATVRGDHWLTSKDFDEWSRGRAQENLKNLLPKKGLKHPFKPGYQYEVAVKPLGDLAIKGVLWYQGESNADNPDMDLNEKKLKDIVASWRKTFHQEELPFLIVQLPRINDPKRPYWAEFREVQDRVARELPGVGIVCTVDLGATNSEVHPRLKAPVGKRLADLALATVYGKKGLPTSPRVKSSSIGEDTITVTFDQELKTTDGAAPRGFVVGDPRKPESFTAAEATLQGDAVELAIPAAAKKLGKAKLAWRYINTTPADPNLVGATGDLPAFPARSDSESKAAKPGKESKSSKTRK